MLILKINTLFHGVLLPLKILEHNPLSSLYYLPILADQPFSTLSFICFLDCPRKEGGLNYIE